MSLRRREHSVPSFEQLDAEIVRRGGAVRGVIYDEHLEGLDTNGKVVEVTDRVTGYFVRTDEFDGSSKQIAFVPDTVHEPEAQIITPEMIGSTCMTVIIRRNPVDLP